MNRKTAEHVAHLAAYLAQRPVYHAEHGDLSPVPAHVAAREAMILARIARKMHRLDELECNGEINEQDAQKRERALSRFAQLVVERFDLIYYRQDDPRGWPLFLGTDVKALEADYHRHGFAVTPHAGG